MWTFSSATMRQHVPPWCWMHRVALKPAPCKGEVVKTWKTKKNVNINVQQDFRNINYIIWLININQYHCNFHGIIVWTKFQDIFFVSQPPVSRTWCSDILVSSGWGTSVRPTKSKCERWMLSIALKPPCSLGPANSTTFRLLGVHHHLCKSSGGLWWWSQPPKERPGSQLRRPAAVA